MLSIALLFIGSYLFGSIPVGVLVGRAFGFDPRGVGSGNIGMTNVTRAGGRKAGAITFVGDLLKGMIPVLAARWAGLPPAIVAIVGLGAFVGAIVRYSSDFQGGKGVSASLGIWLGISPQPVLIALGVFLVVFGALPDRLAGLDKRGDRSAAGGRGSEAAAALRRPGNRHDGAGTAASS